jgi:ubiquitin fusion degradation protein 1
MLFSITNERQNRQTHTSVLEFTAPEGSCYMPYWVRTPD